MPGKLDTTFVSGKIKGNSGGGSTPAKGGGKKAPPKMKSGKAC